MPRKKVKKTIKLVGLEKALEGVPQRERASVAAEILEMFRDFNPENPPGEPVLRLETRVTGPLTRSSRFARS